MLVRTLALSLSAATPLCAAGNFNLGFDSGRIGPTMKHQLGNLTLECAQGNIVEQSDCQAVINAANAQLMPGGGVAGAIHNAAGPELARECQALAPIQPGQAVISLAHNLPNDYVIHCLGPVYGVDKAEAALLANCYRNALQLCDEKYITSLASCALSTGIFDYPLEDAARIALQTMLDYAPQISALRLVRFVLYSEHDLQVHQNVLQELIR